MLNLSKKYINIDIYLLNLKDLKNLQKIIKYHSDLYYNKNISIITDSQYDNLFKKLEYLENKFSIKDKTSLNVWAVIFESTFKKVKHSRSMISLDNTYNSKDLEDFNKRVYKNLSFWNISINQNIEYILEFKFDWLWIELIYDSWKLKQAITRWNGIEWEDVTVNVEQIENIPKIINYKKKLEIRWEVIMPISVFEKINKKAKLDWTKIFSNPRNLASWSLRMKDPNITKERSLKFFAYDVSDIELFIADNNINNYYQLIKKIKKFWFEISTYFKKFSDIKSVIYEIENFSDIKKTIDFEIDWLVLKVNNINLWKKIWTTEHHPKYCISYKFPAEIFTTKILSIDHQIWKTWTITPVANLKVVNMWWASIKRATLHNYEEVEILDIRIADNVFIKRAGEVIPKIISVIKEWDRSNYKKIFPPKNCPSCNYLVKKDNHKVRFFCDNTKCSAQIIEKLIFAVGKQWFNIDWLWEKQIKKFYKLWFIKNLIDIFNISNYKQQILNLEGFQEKSVNKIISEVEKAKNIDISIFINSLCIFWVGKKTSKIFSQLFKNKYDLLNFNLDLQDLEKLEDIWPEIAKNLIKFFKDKNKKKLIKQLSDILNIKYFKKTIINWDSIFLWKKVCITWSFEKDWKKISRDNLIIELEKKWWEFVNSVSKNIDFLIVWEKAWTKLKKAQELWIEILNLEEFLKRI